jgi:RNA polymerase sigma-70 factor (ECF subfamily)
LDLLTALRSLPDRQQEAVVLHYLVDCPVTTVADLMGVSEGTVKAHLHKARAALHALLEVRHA